MKFAITRRTMSEARSEFQSGNIPKVDIVFRDLSYSVHCENGEKPILRDICGKFKAGEISAILGPSGSGKTTLINILAGFKITKFFGQVFINDQSRVLKNFFKISRYIMQENSLHPYLTVLDSMEIAADFKIGSRRRKEEKLQMVLGILENLRLLHVKNSRTETLSGGEKKRLVIALELINNPSIIFLDEPTSGLDEQASFQVISVLKQLAKEGRTVICSIHAPSAKIFAVFDHVFVMTDGQCAYQGPGNLILPFLEEINLPCPIYYNPIDFFIDVASGEYGPHIDKLVNSTQNGRVCYTNEVQIQNCDSSLSKNEVLDLENIPEYYTSTIFQLKVLLYRMILQSYRNPNAIKMKFIMYGFMSLIFSSLYYDVGNDATKIFANLTYLYLSILAMMFCALMPPLIQFPMEIKLIQSEYFNRWYNIPAYFLAKSLAVIPNHLFFITAFVTITYPLSNQPLSVERMVKFITICFFVNLIANASSMAVASVLNIVNSFFIGVVIMVPPACLAVFGFGFPFSFHPVITQLLLRTSFLRFALEALVDVVYGDRPEHLDCPGTEILCPLTSPKVITHVMGYGNLNYWACVATLFGFYVVGKYVNYFLLKQRLRPGLPAKIALKIVAFGKYLLVKYLP